MTRQATALGLLALAASGCTGLRLGPYGIGIMTMAVHRSVQVSADWSPDDRFVLITRHTAKTIDRSSFIIYSTDAWKKHLPDRHEVYRVPASGDEPPTSLGNGTGLEICPAGACVAFHEEREPADKGGQALRRLWLADYAAPEPQPVILDEDVEHYSFSHDGKWLSWNSRADRVWKVVAVARPDEPVTLSAALEPLHADGWQTHRWGMPSDRWRWSTDGALYRLLTRWSDARQALDRRWVRLVPPDWSLEDLGLRPAGVLPATLRDEPPRRPHGLARSLDGSMRLETETTKSRRAGILFLFGLPERTSEVANVVLVLPGHTRRPLTNFRVSRW